LFCGRVPSDEMPEKTYMSSVQGQTNIQHIRWQQKTILFF
jgi:hypothetical protein